jgi:hypothetical protein
MLLMLAVAAPAPAASCRPITVDSGGVGGEEGAYGIRTKKVSCKTARRVLRSYLKTGDIPVQWGLVRRGGSRFLLIRGEQEIRFRRAS